MSAAKKLDLCALRLGKQFDLSQIAISAIDHSDYFSRGGLLFNSKYKIKAISDFKKFKPNKEKAFFHSRFVISYAIQNTIEFFEKISQYSLLSLQDVFNTSEGDFQTFNNGLRQTFMDFPLLVQKLQDNSWEVFVIKIEPDFNSDKKCVVIKLIAINKNKLPYFNLDKFILELNQSKYTFEIINLKNNCPKRLVIDCLNSLSHDNWELLRENKEIFPIWGQPIVKYEEISCFINKLRNPQYDQINFNLGQVNYYISEALNRLKG